MGSEPNKTWGTGPGNYPVSRIADELITPVPYISHGKKNFTDTTTLSISVPVKGATIYYTLDGTEPTLQSKVYTKPVLLNKTSTVRAFASKEGLNRSYILEAHFNKIPGNRSIKLNTAYTSEYSAGGDNALIDSEKGSDNFRTGAWQGYQGVDLDAIVDLGQVQDIKKVSAGFIQDAGSWIFFPVEVSCFLSSDGITFVKFAALSCDIPASKYGSVIKNFTFNIPREKARFVKIVAKNRGICPAGHPGEGGKAWIFADEIEID